MSRTEDALLEKLDRMGHAMITLVQMNNYITPTKLIDDMEKQYGSYRELIRYVFWSLLGRKILVMDDEYYITVSEP